METKLVKGHPNLALLKELNSAIKRLSIYPGDHPAVKLVLKETSELLQEFFKTKTEIVLGKVENKLVLEGETLDASLISEKVWNTLEKQKIKSISFCQGLTQEELRSFLEFFLMKEQEDLAVYLHKNKITHLKFNQLHYEVVSNDEKVVKSELVDKLQFKGELSKVIREHPELLKDILLGKIIDKEKLQVLYGEKAGTRLRQGQSRGSGSGDSEEGWDEGSGGGIGGGFDVKKTLEDLNAEIASLSDDEILTLLTFQLKQSFQNIPQNKENPDEALQMVKKTLEKRDKQKLLPQLKELLSGFGIINERYFDLLINESYQKKEEIVFSGLQFLEELEKNRIEKKNLDEKIKGILHSPDEKLRKKIIDTLLEKLDSKDDSLRQDSITVLNKTIELSISEEKEGDFVYIKEKLLEVQEKNLVSLRFYRSYFEILPVLFHHLVKRGSLAEVRTFLNRACSSIQGKETGPEMMRLKTDFVAEMISTEHNLNLLIHPLISDFNTQKGKEIEEVLEHLDKRKVARKLLEIFTLDQRSVRLWALRILTALGGDSVEAIADFLADKNNLKRIKDQNHLLEESWYKVRNALFVLGNVDTPKSVQLLWDFKNDPDPRVRLEVLKSLESMKGEEVNQIITELLQDKEEEVCKKALNLISASGERDFIPALKAAFTRGHLDRGKLVAAIFKIGEKDCRDFALKLVLDENFPPGSVSKKEKEELQLTALSLLGNNLNDKIVSSLEGHLRKRRKGLLGILHRDEVSGRIAKILSIRDKEISTSKP